MGLFPSAQVLESQACGMEAALIGLHNMLNAGGAVLAAELAGGCKDGLAGGRQKWRHGQEAPNCTHKPSSSPSAVVRSLPWSPLTQQQRSTHLALLPPADEGTNGTRRATLHLTPPGPGRFRAFAPRRPTAWRVPPAGLTTPRCRHTAGALQGERAEGLVREGRVGALWFNVPWREDVGSGPRAAAIVFEAAA